MPPALLSFNSRQLCPCRSSLSSLSILEQSVISLRLGIAGIDLRILRRVPVLVDSLSDGFMLSYRAHPMRYFVFHEGRCVWAARPIHDYPKFEAGYQLDECRPVLNDIIFNKEQHAAWAAAAAAGGGGAGNDAATRGTPKRKDGCACS